MAWMPWIPTLKMTNDRALAAAEAAAREDQEDAVAFGKSASRRQTRLML
jgi:hypothetical protein